ncbi:unnamed protein product [Linum tenue]|uniref:Uncharacterized protein n=1 Tax=Linum tenue TaxID=586396 RepID=A0AAV0SAR1_9ROSI|nr:unnamed protein product [Linum tenue]
MKLYTCRGCNLPNYQSPIMSSSSSILASSFTNKHQFITISNHFNIINLNPIHSHNLANPDPVFLLPQVKQLLKRLRKHHKLPRIASLLRAAYRHSSHTLPMARIVAANRKQGLFAVITLPVLRSSRHHPEQRVVEVVRLPPRPPPRAPRAILFTRSHGVDRRLAREPP